MNNYLKFLLDICNRLLVSLFRIFGRMMKRESGVNPEQTRCCKLRYMSFGQYLNATFSIKGKAARDWSKSEDLPVKVNDFVFRGMKTNQ